MSADALSHHYFRVPLAAVQRSAYITAVFTTLCLLFSVRPAAAQTEFLRNGGFETGDFTAWNRVIQSGSPGNFQTASDVMTPSEGFPTPGPAAGIFYAVTDSNVPGTDDPSAYSLTQAFTLPRTAVDTKPVTLSFSLFVNDWNGFGALNTSGPLDYTQAEPTQYARVDLMTSSALPFSTDEADVVRTFYLGIDGTDPPYGWTDYAFNIAAQTTPGQTYQIRFAAVHNQFSLNMGVDNVSILATTAPEPATLCLLLPIVALTVTARRRVCINR